VGSHQPREKASSIEIRHPGSSPYQESGLPYTQLLNLIMEYTYPVWKSAAHVQVLNSLGHLEFTSAEQGLSEATPSLNNIDNVIVILWRVCITFFLLCYPNILKKCTQIQCFYDKLMLPDFSQSWMFSTHFHKSPQYQISHKSVQWEP
jgi:hypothetical protein